MVSLLTIPCPDYHLLSIEVWFSAIVLNIAMLVGFIPMFNNRVCKKQWIQDKCNAVVEHVFDKLLKKESNEYYILNYKAPANYTNLLFFTLVFVAVSATVQFWDDFLYEETSDCITKSYTCCYGLNQNTTQHVDCSNTSYLEDNNITSIICYQFVFRLGTAAGSALGIIATNALVILIITYSLLKLSDGSNGKGLCRGAITVLIQIGTVLVVLTATVLLCIYNVASNPESAFIKKILEIYPIGLLISLYTVLFPWRNFVKTT